MTKEIENSITTALVRRSLCIRGSDLPDDILLIAKHCLLDWLSVLHRGWSTPVVNAVLGEVMGEAAAPRATLLGSGVKTSMTNAALVNGTASHVLDFDDVHLASRVHPSAPLWPAIIAVADGYGLSGREAITAFVAGVEMQSRVAALMNGHYQKGWHSTATLGSLGATAAISSLRKLNETQACHALGIAATQAAGLRSVFGSMAKPLQVGRAAACGVTSVGLAIRGLTSHSSILDGKDGFLAIYGEGLPNNAALGQLDEFHVRSIIFKYHASCYGTQGPVEAARKLRPLMVCGVEEVEAIVVEVEEQYLTVCNITEPQCETEAKFSIRYMVALSLAGRSTASEESFSPHVLKDPEIVSLRNKITVRGSGSRWRATAAVTVYRRGLAPITESSDMSMPEPDLSEQTKRLSEKSRLLLGGVMNDASICSLISSCLTFDEIGNVADWTNKFTQESAQK